MWISLEPSFHDGIVQSLTVDIAAKQTQIILKHWSGLDDGHYALTNLTFTGVVWQDFRDFNTFNCLGLIHYSKEFADFEKVEKKYLDRMTGYFAPGELEAIKANDLLTYYYIISTAGLDGFIICSQFGFTEQEY